ncbi:protein SRC2 homolog [Solanum dulcamara]|uniref:protein SRC2 homolog n=1 Tax=Solanum dulcamara TaxID=45834 RepID=UPI0024867124|nr:protein SRC2 homolog [Solanum dulcamara]
MGSRYEVEVKITSAKDLKNVNWRYGHLKPYAVVWIDPNAKCSTKVDEDGDTSPYWNEKLVVPLNSPIDESILYIDIVHAGSAEEDTKPLIGSTKIPLSEVVDDVGIGGELERALQLKRPSGRPQGKVEVEVTVREPRYRPRDAYYAPPYGVPPPAQPYNYGGLYGAPPPAGSYGQPAYGVPAAGSYGQPAYGMGGYGQPGGYEEEKKKSKFGMGTGLAVGAVAGALGGLAIAEGIDHLEDNIAEDAAAKVEEDLADDDGDYGDDDF